MYSQFFSSLHLQTECIGAGSVAHMRALGGAHSWACCGSLQLSSYKGWERESPPTSNVLPSLSLLPGRHKTQHTRTFSSPLRQPKNSNWSNNRQRPSDQIDTSVKTTEHKHRSINNLPSLPHLPMWHPSLKLKLWSALSAAFDLRMAAAAVPPQLQWNTQLKKACVPLKAYCRQQVGR